MPLLPNLNRRMRRAAGGQNIRRRRKVQGFGGIAPGDQPTKPHEGMVQFGQDNQRWGVPQAQQQRNLGQPGVQWDTGWGTPGQGGGMGNHQLPGQTPPIHPPLPSAPQPQAAGLPRDQQWGEHGNITQAAADAAGSYAAAGRAQGVANFSLQEWEALPPDVLAQNLQTLWNTPGASRFMTEDQMLQLQTLGQQRGVALPYALGAGGGASGPAVGAPTDPLGHHNTGTYGGGLAGGAANVTPEQMTQGNAPAQAQGAQGNIRPITPVATPQAAEAAGKDPTKHLAYWESVGWSYNPATGAWRDVNGDRPNPQGQGGGQGRNNPRPTDPNGPQNPAPAPGQPASNTLPLDPQFEAQRRLLDADLQRQLSSIGAGRGRLTAEQELALARLGTNEGVDKQRLLESMAGRGTLNSSIYGDNLGLLATDYSRQHQDLTSSLADAMAGLATQEGDVQGSYEQGLLEALLGTAERSAADPYAPVSRSAPGRRRRNRNRRRRRRGNS